MRIDLYCALLLLLISPVFPAEAEVVDRMVAVVNKQVILQSELEQAVRVEFLLQGKPLDQLTDAEMRGVLDRLIDQSLLQQQIAQTDVLDPSPEELTSRLQEVRSQIPGADADEKWRAMLAGYGVTEQDVGTQLISQIRVLRFIDLRFRGLVNADKTAVTTYYQEKLLPELRRQGAPVPPLDQVSSNIEKILVEQRINELLADWLQTLRTQSHIEKMSENGATPGVGPTAAGSNPLNSSPVRNVEGNPANAKDAFNKKRGSARTAVPKTGAKSGIRTGADQ
ncbi:MAG TPA: SurA N-terminal domain-containing protein [Candidatus Solibacter sp.]|nr:SurA N-terminal domain-containing protein [Candidatus Solibacter sp.]